MEVPKSSIILVAGGSCMGKTTFARRLREWIVELGESATIVSMDWFYLPLPDGVDPLTYNFDVPESFDSDKINAGIDNLIGGRSITVAVHDFSSYGRKTSTMLVEPATHIIVEGLYAHSLALRYINDPTVIVTKIFVMADRAIAWERRKKRDQAERGYEIDEIKHRWGQVIEAYERFVIRQISDSDAVYVNDEDFVYVGPGHKFVRHLL